LVIDVGARSAAEARDAGVRLLAPVTLRKDLAFLPGSRVGGPSLEGRAGCAALLELARRLNPRRLQGQLILAWSAQSWVGFRGSARLARRFAADEVLVVDPYASDPPPSPPPEPGGVLGRGPFLTRSEEKSGTSGELEAGLRRAARDRSIPVQSVRIGSLHDGKPFLGRRVAVVGIPLRFPGTPAEMVDLRDLDSLVEWLTAYLEDGPR
jgi:putative aminopeptidase FrvX